MVQEVQTKHEEKTQSKREVREMQGGRRTGLCVSQGHALQVQRGVVISVLEE